MARFGIALIALVVGTWSHAAALDLTGTWEGRRQCKTFSAGTPVSTNVPSSLRVSQSGGEVAVEIDGAAFGGVAVASTTRPRSNAGLVRCGTTDQREAGAAMASFDAASGASPTSARGKGSSIEIGASGEVTVCRFSYRRTDAADPSVSSCPPPPVPTPTPSPVFTPSPSPEPGQVTMLDHRVVDAEFSRALGLVVTVSEFPSRLNAIDPDTGAVARVALPLAPTSVSVGPDGSLAAVGHNGFISIVDLVTATLLDVHPVSTDVYDIVLAGNGFAYAFPRIDQWERIRCIDVVTGVETLHTGTSVYHRTRAKLHPSGDFIYGANNGLSPSDFEKYDIRPGTAVRLYDSPYHGDFSFAGNIWIADDGTKLYAQSGNVFRSSELQSGDMLYGGSLEGSSLIGWLDHSSAAARIYLVLADPGENRVVRVHDPMFNNFLGTIALPQMSGGGSSVDARGRFVFVSEAADRVHVLVQAPAAAGFSLDWGIVTLDVAAGP